MIIQWVEDEYIISQIALHKVIFISLKEKKKWEDIHTNLYPVYYDQY